MEMGTVDQVGEVVWRNEGNKTKRESGKIKRRGVLVCSRQE